MYDFAKFEVTKRGPHQRARPAIPTKEEEKMKGREKKTSSQRKRKQKNTTNKHNRGQKENKHLSAGGLTTSQINEKQRPPSPFNRKLRPPSRPGVIVRLSGDFKGQSKHPGMGAISDSPLVQCPANGIDDPFVPYSQETLREKMTDSSVM